MKVTKVKSGDGQVLVEPTGTLFWRPLDQRLDFALLPLRRSDARLVPGLALAHLLQPHRDPHINPVERFYLDTEMSAIVDHKNKNIPFCRILCSLDVGSLSVIIGAYILMMLYLITHLRVYLSDVLRLHIGERGFWTTIPFAVMIVTGYVMAIFSDWVVNSGLVNVVMMRKVCTNIGKMEDKKGQGTERVTTERGVLGTTHPNVDRVQRGMGPAVYTLSASYAGCDRQLSVVMFIIATALMGSSLTGFRLIILEISPNYSGSVAAFCNCIGIILVSFTPKFIAWVVPNVTQDVHQAMKKTTRDATILWPTPNPTGPIFTTETLPPNLLINAGVNIVLTVPSKSEIPMSNFASSLSITMPPARWAKLYKFHLYFFT
ncbi:hypothetical protein GEV33_006327 [Tenebrio molitor]|uniref:Uncharacterized protein n=1 Tax=Tenebrio molitor TaxID=7067 RepID=A0A8J6HKQ2_TENMO|nr:hypothetical protein GEV33_006327 [Tenebrio molitor]